MGKKFQADIFFKIAGTGPQEHLVKSYELKNSNLEFLGRLSKPKLLEQYFVSDLGLTQHVSGATQSVTYKLFDLLGNRLPILNSLESEMKDIILENRVGLHNAPGDHMKLAENIKAFHNDREILCEYKQNALAVTKKLGDSKVVYGKMIDLLESVVN